MELLKRNKDTKILVVNVSIFYNSEAITYFYDISCQMYLKYASLQKLQGFLS